MTKRFAVLVLALLAVLAAACAGTPAAGEATPAEKVTLRLKVPADPDVADVPWLIAVDELRAQGYTIKTVSFSDRSIEVAAMVQGDMDMAALNTQIVWAAIGKGAPLFTFIDKSANAFILVARKDIGACRDLAGQPVAVPGVGTTAGALLDGYIAKHCPGTEVQTIVVAGGSSRLAALFSGEVAATTQDIDDLVALERERPGEFHTLAAFAQDFPDVHTSTIVVRRAFAEQHPEAVKDVIRALFTARRSIQDPAVLRDAIVKYLELDPKEAQQLADVYLAQEMWDVRGTYSLARVRETLGFLQEQGSLPAELKAEDVADLSYYDEVVSEMERQ